jgi:hypothetical protein
MFEQLKDAIAGTSRSKAILTFRSTQINPDKWKNK